jgi:general stress protein 26
MKRFYLILVWLLVAGCQTSETKKEQVLKNEFTAQEQKILQTARQIIDSAYYGTLITFDASGDAKARVMEPFSPENNFVIYLATNPKSRKVNEIKQNNKATLHYFDKPSMGYVSLYRTVELVNDKKTKQHYWKKGWERFYKDQDKNYLLIRFTPKYLEMISITKGFTGDKETWMPSRVDFIK